MLSSVMNEGVRGLQNSQREIVKSATEISKANIPTDPGAAVSVAGPVNETSFAPVTESSQVRPGGDNLSEPLIELRRQEQLFDASAKVISVADKTIGSLLDVTT